LGSDSARLNMKKSCDVLEKVNADRRRDECESNLKSWMCLLAALE